MRIIDDKSRNFCNNNLLKSLILNTIHPIRLKCVKGSTWGYKML